jgi:hypothetical protein
MIQTAAIQFTPEILGVVAGIDELKGAWSALGTLAPHRLNDDTQVYKQFVQNESFKRFVGDMVFAITSP